MSDLLTTLNQELTQKRSEMKRIFELSDTGQVDPETGAAIYKMDQSLMEELPKREKELADLEQRYQAARLADMKSRNDQELLAMHRADPKYPISAGSGGGSAISKYVVDMDAQAQGKSLSAFVCDNIGYKGRGSSRRWSVNLENIDVKTLLQTSAGWTPPRDRGPVVVDYAVRRPVVQDLIPQDQTGTDVVKFMEETTFTNAATNVSEGTVKPESALAWTERSATVEKVATWIPATEEQLDDVPQLRAILDRRLGLMIALTEEDDILNGNGAGKIDGFLHKSGTQSQAFSTNNADTVFKAFTLIRHTGFAEPSGIVLHPNNWETIRLMKEATTNAYIWGHPAVVGPETLWGKPVIVTTAITANTGLVGDFVMFSHISRRMGLRIDVSDSHDTYFIYNKLAIRAESRLSLEIYRPAAFCKLTSLT